MKISILHALAYLTILLQARGASIIVNWSTTRMLWSQLPPLSAGSPADGDGALLQLGYFSQATPSSPFAGTWMVIATGTIGDQGGAGDGYFAISTTLVDGMFVAPVIGTPLGVRFFDGPSVTGSSFYNTAVNVDGTGLWQAPGDPSPVINLVLSKEASRCEGFPVEWRTSIPIPEPSVILFGGMGVGLVLRRRNRMPPGSACPGRRTHPPGRR